VEVARRGRAAHLLIATRWQSPAVNRRGPAPGTAAHPWRFTGGGLVRRGRTALRSAPLVCALVVGALLLVEAHRLHGRARRAEPLKPMRLFHWSTTYLTILFVAVAIDALV